MVDVAQRFQVAQSWWIAAELARRNPHLFAYEYHPGGGQYDTLGLFDDRRPQDQAVANLNRAGGSVWLGTARKWGRWDDVMATDDPHTVVKALEKWANLRPAPGQATTPRSLAYRVIAHTLGACVNAREPFDARLEHVDSPYSREGSTAGYVAGFPAAVEAQRNYPRLGWHGEPASHQWALLRGDEPVAILDVHGSAFLGAKRTDLMEVYRATGRRLTPTVAVALGKVLP